MYNFTICLITGHGDVQSSLYAMKRVLTLQSAIYGVHLYIHTESSWQYAACN